MLLQLVWNKLGKLFLSASMMSFCIITNAQFLNSYGFKFGAGLSNQ